MLIIAVSLLFVYSYCQVAPPFPTTWTVPFSETVKEVISKTFKGMHYYDWTVQGTMVTFEKGQIEPLCATERLFNTNECQQFTIPNKKYLYFPDNDHCCLCVYLGSLMPNFTRFANYSGVVQIGDNECDEWSFGAEGHIYYTLKGTSTPCAMGVEFPGGGPTTMSIYDVTKINYDPIDPAIFKVPDSCLVTGVKECGGVCKALRGKT